MTKQEKYFNYVVDSLMRKTSVGKNYTIDLPYSHGRRLRKNRSERDKFWLYVRDMYGVKPDEIISVWKEYTKRVDEMVKDYLQS
tara:strand:- start:395 stop:646 length:252 start_codon:yes stop_codon:yes gene_type:complete